jgi:conjugative relaxase-like TrwC/TraI family protein
MTVSMRVVYAGKGYRYLLKSVAVGDGDRMMTDPLTRYYAEDGTPPGRWMGSGASGFGDGQITVGSTLTETQLVLLLGMGRDPVTGEQLGRAFPKFTSVADRIAERTAKLSPDLTPEEREAEVARIEAEETERGSRHAVSGFDFTFSVPKSVSVLWGVADAGTQALIADAHHAAVAQVLDFIEREVAATRIGITAGDGPVAQVAVNGVAATAYDHWDSRAGDPQLHTHVVISVKAQAARDGRWRALDSRPMHAATVAVSELYNAVLADRLTGAFGLGWDARDRGANRNPAWEVTGVSEDLIGEFSGRSRQIDEATDEMIAEYVDRHGRRPSPATIIQLRAGATLTTRPEKHIKSLANLTADWRTRADAIVGRDSTVWARSLTTGPAQRVLRADDVPLDLIGEVGRTVVERVSEKRSTWRHWNLSAEASRQMMGWRFATMADRELVLAMVIESAQRASLALSPPELAISPHEFRRPDGSSEFRPRYSVVFSSEQILAAEDRLLARAADTTATTVDIEVVERITSREIDGQNLSIEQAESLASVAVSGRQVDLLIGPAGAGKTTAMRALHRAWTSQHGKGSVVGLAPSAASAEVLAGDLKVGCENTAKWLHEYDRGRARFTRGQLVIVDEATLAGTMTLDRLTALAAEAGAKVLLVGDWAQLQSVDAGGAFAMLAAARDDTPELTEIHRFTHAWEKHASLDLRNGRTEAIGTYLRHKRVHEGTTEEMIDAAYAAWHADVRVGRATLLVTEAAQAVTELNQRARAERILEGDTSGSREVILADGTRASAGDLVITRRNDRRLRTLRGGWVRNGDRWQITDVRADGSVVARRLDRKFGGTVMLPAAYVAEYLDLGYAVTAHRAQGITVDTAHVVVTGSTTRENLYVSMTRGRDSNIAYVALDRPDETHTPPHPDDVNARAVLYGVLHHSGVELSAHQTIESEQEHWSTVAQLAAEYETIAAAAQHDRWADLVRRSGLTPEQAEAVIESDSFGPLTAELRRAEANHHDLEKMLPRVVARRSLDDADDIGAVLLHRLSLATNSPAAGTRRLRPRLIAGLIPEAVGAMSEEMRTALDQRRDLIEARAMTLAEGAVATRHPWVRRLGEPPIHGPARARWIREVTTVAAYRDRYLIDSRLPLGDRPASDAQRLDAARANSALRRAKALADDAHHNQLRARSAALDGPSI